MTMTTLPVLRFNSMSAVAALVVLIMTGVCTDSSVEAFSPSSWRSARPPCSYPSSTALPRRPTARIHNKISARTLVLPANQKSDDNDDDTTRTTSSSSPSANKAAAEKYLAQAQALRQELQSSASPGGGVAKNQEDPEDGKAASNKPPSPWNLPIPLGAGDGGAEAAAAASFVDYRLYVNIGREEGSWMDPRWGASGRRIDWTLDVRFHPNQQVASSSPAARRMVSDNWGGHRSPVHRLESASWARLRNGFDRMQCNGGAYRIDASSSSSSSSTSLSGTARFYLEVEGKTDGDVSIPPGCLYFSLPVFSNSARQLSTKEGIVSVRQMGWHTGWRREESRIVGTFRAVPIDKAQRLDGF